MNLNRSLQTYQKLNHDPIVDLSGLRRPVLGVLRRPTDCKALRGMTLVELMVAIAVGSMVIGLIAVASMTASLWFGSLANYVDMDAKSRNALDRMSLNIRQAGALTGFSSTRLEFAVPGQTNASLVYDWDSATGSLTEWKSGETNTLLTGCEQLSFSLYDASFAAITNYSQAKGLSVKWNCSRMVLGRKNTEEMQQALIVIRN